MAFTSKKTLLLIYRETNKARIVLLFRRTTSYNLVFVKTLSKHPFSLSTDTKMVRTDVLTILTDVAIVQMDVTSAPNAFSSLSQNSIRSSGSFVRGIFCKHQFEI